jgi:Spy/CpxP family protein refolding chaperone
MIGKLMLTVILAATPALAQQGGGGGQDLGDMDSGMLRPQQPVSKAVLFANRLNLDKSQKEQTQAILVDSLKEIAELRSQIEKVRAQIAILILSNGNQDEIRRQMETSSATATQVTNIEVKAFTKICALLKPGQKSKAASTFDLLAAMLDPPSSSGWGAAGRGTRGRR